jgi:hypothetical protein
MIIVSGQPRSGTSLQMMILRELGISIAGQKRPNDAKKENNPLGTWEVPKIVLNGLTKNIKEGKVPTILSEPITEDAIKLITVGLMCTDYSLIDKVIFCIRDPREICTSVLKIQDGNNAVVDIKTPEDFYRDYNSVINLFFLKLEPHDWENILVVDYGMIQANPGEEVMRVADFVGKPITKSAIDIVKPELYRSEPHEVENEEAMNFYNKLMEGVR